MAIITSNDLTNSLPKINLYVIKTNRAIIKIATTKYLAITSTAFWNLGLINDVSSTVLIIFASTVSLPTALTFITIVLDKLVVDPITLLPTS